MRPFDPKDCQRILLVSFSNIGDAVLSLPVLDRLERTFSHAQIDVLVGPRARVVFENDPRVHALWVYDRFGTLAERIRFFFSLRQKRYDLVVDLRKSLFRYLGRWRNRLFEMGLSSHRRTRCLEALQPLGIPIDPKPEEGFRLPEGTRIKCDIADEPGSKGVLVVIAPGARSQIKQWDSRRFGLLADRLIQYRGASVVWIGDDRERPLVEKIQSRMMGFSLNLAGQTSWSECCALIQKADLLITNDSAPLHAADHVGRKVLAFFGPTDPEKYGPQHNGVVLFRHKFCSPCEQAQCRYQLECMDEITLEEAYKSALRLLDNGTHRDREALKILVIRLDRIGDVLLTLPLFSSLRRYFPKSHLTALVQPQARGITDRSMEVTDTLVYDYKKGGVHHSLRGYFRFVRELRRRRYDLAFIPHPTLRSHLLAFLAGIPVRVGLKTRGSFLLTLTVPDRRREGAQHESLNALEVLKPLGIPQARIALDFPLYLEDEAKARRVLKESGVAEGEPYVVFHAGSSSISKRWPADRFVALARLFHDAWKVKIVLVGDRRHETLNCQIQSQLGSLGCNITGKTDLACLGAILKGGRLVVSNDSGPVHLAAAVETPVISIFGRNQPGLSPKRWGPLGPASRFLHWDPGCGFCLADDCPIDFECLKAIEPLHVFECAKSLVQEPMEHLQAIS